jgi:hypothetical protein
MRRLLLATAPSTGAGGAIGWVNGTHRLAAGRARRNRTATRGDPQRAHAGVRFGPARKSVAPAGCLCSRSSSTLTASTALRAPAAFCKPGKCLSPGSMNHSKTSVPRPSPRLLVCCLLPACPRPRPHPRPPSATGAVPRCDGRLLPGFFLSAWPTLELLRERAVRTGRHDPCSTTAGTTQRTCLCSGPSLGQHSSPSPSAQQPSPGHSPGIVWLSSLTTTTVASPRPIPLRQTTPARNPRRYSALQVQPSVIGV